MKNKLHVTPVAGLCWASLLIWGAFFAGLQYVVDTIELPGLGGNMWMGSLITLFFVGYMTASFFMGEVSDRIGKKRAIFIMLGIKIAGELLVFITGQPVLLVLGVVLSGAGFGVLESMFTAVQADETNHSSSTMLLSQMCFSVGALAAPWLVRSALAFEGGWRYFFLCDAVLLCLVAIAFWRTACGGSGRASVPLDPSRGQAAVLSYGSAPTVRFKRRKAALDDGPVAIVEAVGANDSRARFGGYTLIVLKQPLFILLGLSLMCYLMMETAATFWCSAYFKSISSENLGALALTLFYVFMTLFRAVSAFIKDAEHKIVLASNAVLFIGFLGMMLLKDPIANVICVALCGIGCAAIWPILVAIAGKAFKEYSGTAITLMLCAAGLGGIIMPVIFGALSDSANISTAYILVLASSVMLAVFYIMSIRKQKRGRV